MELKIDYATIKDIEDLNSMFLEILDSLKYYNNQAIKNERIKYSTDELYKKYRKTNILS